ncbi:septal ring lytic transglycosylase RlpA family protein [Flavobacterium sp. NST-5]|uniref:Probable endolytic peptidoglycan transglycosylase RlpA n=1 Tax=Flavobacterium ichthyis TaxID=2698827 RepID=A0ABW9Z766_9FLAO|nr:septal ring lytic transglycosylase RlpA family protein [Flavobacterium ichthyis]NBL64716.1 septal ring lytic transglycosylase RlpA family protein [Flavobacterium ichthyis]
MKKKITIILTVLLVAILANATLLQQTPSQKIPPQKTPQKVAVDVKIMQDSLKKAMMLDSLKIEESKKYKLFKKNANASYYADKFTGRRTASGKIFDNKKYTAAHRKLPFGTKLRVTSEKTGKSVIVEITDRGPFVKGKDIDLSKKAFMDIAPSRYGGAMKVTLEIVQ